MSGCVHGAHLELVHMAVSHMPMLVVLPPQPDEAGERPKCAAAEIDGPGPDGPKKIFEEDECDEDAWATIGFPGVDRETDDVGAGMGVVDLCRRHFALLILQGEELTRPLGT